MFTMQDTGSHIILERSEYDSLLTRNRELEEKVKSLEETVEVLIDRVKELEGMLRQYSGNSHKPPGSDGYRKEIKNNREKSSKSQGAQKGHEGKMLKMVGTPDKIVKHKVQGQCKCGNDLEQAQLLRTERRQVFDLPDKLMEVTEHRVEIRQCSCGAVHRAECKEKANVQYGGRIKSWAVYMNQYQFVPFERLQEMMGDCLGVSMSDGVLAASNEKCYEKLEKTEGQIKQALQESKVIHNDETGIRCKSKLHWIHSSSTGQYTHYGIQEKRGKEGIDAIGILPNYKGISVHDRWASYDNYACTHSFCNSHLLRELKWVKEEVGRAWAEKMITLLVHANNLKKENKLNATTISFVEEQYRQIIGQGSIEEPPLVIPAIKRRGRIKKPKSLKLLETFIDNKEQILRFVHIKDVPFDNNLAERDIRMVKLKQKISGCFRTSNGAQIFCRIRSYISTIRKQGYPVLDAIEMAIAGNPIEIYL